MQSPFLKRMAEVRNDLVRPTSLPSYCLKLEAAQPCASTCRDDRWQLPMSSASPALPQLLGVCVFMRINFHMQCSCSNATCCCVGWFVLQILELMGIGEFYSFSLDPAFW